MGKKDEHRASLVTQFASWCASYLLGPITFILINKHTTHNLSKQCVKIWHMFGGCSVPATGSGSTFLKLLGWKSPWRPHFNILTTLKPPLLHRPLQSAMWSVCLYGPCWGVTGRQASPSLPHRAKKNKLLISQLALNLYLPSAQHHAWYYKEFEDWTWTNLKMHLDRRIHNRRCVHNNCLPWMRCYVLSLPSSQAPQKWTVSFWDLLSNFSMLVMP